jgi:hypothetical protein
MLDPAGEHKARAVLRRLGYPWGQRRAEA